MLGFSFGEIMVISLVALVAVGPQKLPGMLKTMGQWVRKLRQMTMDVRQQTGIDEMLRAEGIQISELRSLMRGYHAPAAAPPAPVSTPSPSPPPPRYDDPYGELEPDPTREYPLEGADAYGALPDDLLEPSPPAEAAAAPGPAPSPETSEPSESPTEPTELAPSDAVLEPSDAVLEPSDAAAPPPPAETVEVATTEPAEPAPAEPVAPTRSAPPPPPSRSAAPRLPSLPPPPPRRSSGPPRVEAETAPSSPAPLDPPASTGNADGNG